MIIEQDNINKSILEKDSFLLPLIKDLEYNPFGKVLVLSKKEIIGYLYYSDIYDRAEINDFKIKSEYRNKGNGEFLLTEFLKRVTKPITLEVKKDNYIAINLYKKYGFCEKAIRGKYYQGVDGILMEKK